MKIYQIVKGELKSLEVRETKKSYIAEKVDFDFSAEQRFLKSDCSLSPAEAINKAIIRRSDTILLFRDRIKKLREMIRDLKKLKKKVKHG